MEMKEEWVKIMNIKKIIGGFGIVLLLLAIFLFQGEQAAPKGEMVVLYDSAKIGVIEKNITLDLKKGINEVPLEEIAGLNIEEATLTPMNSSVYVLGIVSKLTPEKGVYESNIGKDVMVKLRDGEEISGKLLGLKNGNVLVEGDRLYVINPNEIAYLKVSGIEKGTAQVYAIIQAESDGKYSFDLIYRIAGIGWSSRYKLYLGDKAKLFGYVVIDNPTKEKFENADVALVSGEVNFYMQPRTVYALAKEQASVGTAPSIQPEKLEAFYIYRLGTVSLNPFEKKMIPYVYQEAPFEREYLYESYPYTGSGSVYESISFKTEKVLPAGIVEIYKEMNGSNILIGERMIQHTPKGDILRIGIGKDIDLKGTTKVLEEKRGDRYSYYKIMVTVENFGKGAKTVIVRHYKRGVLKTSSVKPLDETANYVEFKVTVGPGEKKEIVFDYEISY